jgi:hypothetical protein
VEARVLDRQQLITNILLFMNFPLAGVCTFIGLHLT